MSTARSIQRLTALLFVLGLVAPTADLFLRPHEARSVLRENRQPSPAPPPITDLATLAHFPIACERWFADRMGGRDLLLRSWQRLRWLELGLDPLPMILRGSDGCDFYPLEDAAEVNRGARPYSEAELALVTRSLESQRNRCARLGAEFVYVIAPNKETIYPEKWPAKRARIGPTRLEQLYAWLKLKSDVRCVDLRRALLLERELDRPELDDYVYYPLGSHFTWRGGFAAWNAVATELNQLFPSVRALARTDYALEESSIALDSLWTQTYVNDLQVQRGWVLAPRHAPDATLEIGQAGNLIESRNDEPDLPTALFVHDSYGPWMTPFAARSFSHMWTVREQRVPHDHIERHRPRVVIHELTERRLAWNPGDPGYDIEHVSPAAFQAFEPYFGPVDSARDPVFKTSGGVTLEPSAAGVVIAQRAGDGLIDLPPASLGGGAELALHMHITAPFEAEMLLYFLTGSETHYARARVLALALKAGENDLYLRLPVPDLRGSVRMRLSGSGDYLLRAFEMRAAH